MKIKKSWFKTEIEITPEECEKFYTVVNPEISSRMVWSIIKIIEKLSS